MRSKPSARGAMEGTCQGTPALLLAPSFCCPLCDVYGILLSPQEPRLLGLSTPTLTSCPCPSERPCSSVGTPGATEQVVTASAFRTQQAILKSGVTNVLLRFCLSESQESRHLRTVGSPEPRTPGSLPPSPPMETAVRPPLTEQPTGDVVTSLPHFTQKTVTTRAGCLESAPPDPALHCTSGGRCTRPFVHHAE